MDKKKYKITGMSCAACVAAVDRAVKRVSGVDGCEINLLLGSMAVTGDASSDEIISAVRSAGYGAALDNGENKAEREEESPERKSIMRIVKRLIPSSVLLLLLMYISMGHIMWGLPLPSALSSSPLALGVAQLIISALIIVLNKDFYLNGARGIVHFAPNMDTLVSLGSGVSFIYSVYMLFVIGAKVGASDIHGAHGALHSLYFESASMILVLISVGKLFEAIAKGKTTSAVRALMDLAPKRAKVIRDGIETEVDAKEIEVGEVIILRRGDTVAADGTLIKGGISVDESALTGEGIPKDITVGGKVLGATTVLSGYAELRADAVGEEVAFSKIIKTVKEASGSKAPVAKAADKISGIFVPFVLAVALVTFTAWMMADGNFAHAISRAVSVLVISCPCALGLATPVAVMVGSGVGARYGILYKNAEALELSGKIKTVCIDKTGTLTVGAPTLADTVCFTTEKTELLAICSALERPNEHPLAKAIVRYSEDENIPAFTVGNYEAHIGGVSGTVGGKDYFIGNRPFTESVAGAVLKDNALSEFLRLSDEGKTVLIVSGTDSVIGLLALSDGIKEDSAEAVGAMNSLGIKTVMITGDNEKSAEYVATRVGISRVYAGVLPEEKADIVDKLRAEGVTAMIGDGINDSVALTKADVGIAVGRGADVAIDSAGVVLTGSSISSAYEAIRLGRKTLLTVYENLFWAFIYNVIGIPLAAGLFSRLLGWELDPMFGAAAMSLSSFIVVINALRLNLFKPKLKIKDMQTNVDNNKEKNEMNTVVIKIEGMMCPHCSGRVKTVLEAISGVASADVSHERGDAIVTLSGATELSVLHAAITDAGYKVIG